MTAAQPTDLAPRVFPSPRAPHFVPTLHVGGRAPRLVEQRYRAVPEVLDGSSIREVAQRYGVSRQAVYTWKAKYAAGGFEGLREASRRPRTSPTRLLTDVEVGDPGVNDDRQF
ncbi:helix-turn-helix domain-containing protein [Streptomyces sp. S1D4-11]